MTYIPEVGDVVDITLSNAKVKAVERVIGGYSIDYYSGCNLSDTGRQSLFFGDSPDHRSVEVTLRDRPSKYVEGDMIERRDPINPKTISVAVKNRDGRWTIVYSDLLPDGRAAVNNYIDEATALYGWVRDIRKNGLTK